MIADILAATGAPLTDREFFILYATLAAIYAVDAVFYVLAWIQDMIVHDKPLLLESAAWGEILYLLSALFGLAAAGVSFLPYRTDELGPLEAVANSLAYLSMLSMSNLLYAVDAAV